ncbi:kinase-like domain-containing protein [Cokeromyces recurvatus]|uniref:kinase-like domain-containing protein n=1 Tax=Cokeromyces recurvatus TaxID=90255 RepID=UPI00222074CC|nr:kinase-like domain-containing protein [Cokeromyces recurvatus]KAI7901972.1 kinase-like domain-containing protein [Cokeromyces recurvatus]
MTSNNTITAVNATVFQQKQPEEIARQYLTEVLDLKDLPTGTLQEVLKDGTILCRFIQRFAPNECININEGHNKFAYQDNIGQFLRVAENLHIPQSDLFQTVDLLEDKRMQSVVSCILAIKRIMSERKLMPSKKITEAPATGKRSGNSARNSLLLASTALYQNSKNMNINMNPSSCIGSINDTVYNKLYSKISSNSTKSSANQYFLNNQQKNTSTSYLSAVSNNNSTKKKNSIDWQKKLNGHLTATDRKKAIAPQNTASAASAAAASAAATAAVGNGIGGYVKSQVQMITTNNNLTIAEPVVVKVRRFSSSENSVKKEEENSQQLETKKPATKLSPVTVSLPPLPPIPKPSKSTPLVAATEVTVNDRKPDTNETKSTKNNRETYYTNIESSRKTSLKKMGSCAITVEGDDGISAVYALGKSIGKGQFGEVFGGLNMDTGEYVAIKRIRRNQMECDDMNEVGVLKHLNSEHIVRYKGFSKDKEYLNIILEYVEMGSLRNNIKAFGKFPEKLAASYTYKILSGLHYLHSKDVIHCDLKAANILLTKTGGLKLTDFGVSLSLKMKDDENTGEPAGTPNWMAPEVIKFAGASAKSDIWSLGCTVVEMLTGKPPYAGMPSFAALYKIVEDEEPPIPKNIKLSKEATEFLMACFKKNPEDRPSAYELMKSKWMESYFKSDQSLLEVPTVEYVIKKSKSETNLEYSSMNFNSEPISNKDRNDYLTHNFVDYQTYQEGEKCSGCSIYMKRQWVKSCKECHLTFHSYCINKALPCTKGYPIPTMAIKPNPLLEEKVSSNARYKPLGPITNIVGKNKKSYVSIMQQQPNGLYQHFKSEGYLKSKGNNSNRRNLVVSSIMT